MTTEYTGRTIDLTPTWTRLLPGLIELVRSPATSAEDLGEVMHELIKMASAADEYRKLIKDRRLEKLESFADSNRALFAEHVQGWFE